MDRSASRQHDLHNATGVCPVNAVSINGDANGTTLARGEGDGNTSRQRDFITPPPLEFVQ